MKDLYYSIREYNILKILNESRQDYLDYYLSKGYLVYRDWSETKTIPAWKHIYTWTFALSENGYQICDTDMTVAEIQTMDSYILIGQATAMVDGQWYMLSNQLQ